MTYGSDGRTSSGPATTQMFDGDPVAGTGWTEGSAAIPPGDRRGLLTSGPMTLPAGQQHTFELAYVFGQSPHRGVAPGILALRQKVDQLRTAYANGTVGTPREVAPASASLHVFPNPAHGTATVRAVLPRGVQSATLTLRDALGRVIRTTPLSGATPSAMLDFNGVVDGLYVATLTAPDSRVLARQRVMVAGE